MAIEIPRLPGAAGGPTGAIVSAVVGALNGLFGGIFSSGQSADRAIGQLRDEVNNLGNTLLQGLVQAARAVGKILIYLGMTVFGFFRNALKLLGKLLEKLVELYEKHLKPILDAIEKIRRRVLQIYERILRPVLLVMQRVHQVLTILRLFHLKFAAKLDAELQNLEAKLFRPMYQLLGYLNQVANMLNLVFDARLVLRRTVTLNALDQTKGSWTRIWWNAQTKPVSSQAFLELKKQSTPPADVDLGIYFDEFAYYGTGPYQVAVDEVSGQI